ncbi:MAG: transcriptional repressor [Kineothrix sp.]
MTARKNSRKQEGRKDFENFKRKNLQKGIIISKLKEQGCRITKQRLTLLDIILEHECSSCKEIYYRAAKVDDSIGTATVYRMVNVLEEIGAISRRNMYKVTCSEHCPEKNACTIVLDDDTTYHLSAGKWNEVIRAGLASCGYLVNQSIASVAVSPCECEEGICN